MLEDQNTDFLNNIQAKGQPSTLTDDINNYTPQDLSPEQLSAYQESAPSTGMLPNTAYYPDINHRIAVGNYSGSEIGSTTLFAPGGGLVPIGMMDARDLAAQKAAMAKAKQIEDFNKKYQAPSTKLQTVQPKLTEGYMSFLKKSNEAALRKSGGNQLLANKMLENDPNFQERNKNFQDFAKLYDTVVEHSAQLDASEKDPNFVIPKELRDQQRNLLSSVNALGNDPFSENARGIANKFIASKSLYDMTASANDVLKNLKPDVTEDDVKNLTYTTRGKNELYSQAEKTFYPDEDVRAAVHADYMQKYNGMPGAPSEEDYYKFVKSLVPESVKQKIGHYDKYFKPDKNDGSDKYSESDINKEPSSTNVYVSTGGGESREGEITGEYGITHKKAIPAVVPTGQAVYINDPSKGLIKTKEVSPNANVKLFKSELVQVVDDDRIKEHNGTPLTKDVLENGYNINGKNVKVKTKWVPMTTGVIVEGTGDEKKETQFFTPTKNVENALVKKRGKGGEVTEGVPVDKLEAEANRRNAENKTTQQPSAKKKIAGF